MEMTRDDVMRETVKHVRRVGNLLAQCSAELTVRAINHDDSKFSEQEWPYFAEATPRLKGLTYGTPEYRASLDAIRPAINHHNAHNRHHPEFHSDGVQGMTLIDLMEMLADWKAATERHADGSLDKSFAHNRGRFGITPEIEAILRNTAVSLGWLPDPTKEPADEAR